MTSQTIDLGVVAHSVCFDDAFHTAKTLFGISEAEAVTYTFKGSRLRIEPGTTGVEAYTALMKAATAPTSERTPADLDLHCPYCTVGGLDPIHEPQIGIHPEHLDFLGFECDTCSAEWNRYGDPVAGAHISSMETAARRATSKEKAHA